MNFSQITDITIPEGTVTQITANSAVLWKKVTTPQWSEWYSFSASTKGFSITFTNTGLTTPPEKVIIQVQTTSGNISQNSPYQKNNYFISNRSAHIINGQINTIILYPIWTQSGSNYVCNLYAGNTSGYSLTLTYYSNTGNIAYHNVYGTGSSTAVYGTARVIFNYDPTEEDFTRILNSNWNWNVNNSSSWGSNPTAFQNFTLPVTYTRIKFNSITNNNATPNYMSWRQNVSSYPTIYNIDTTNLNKYVIELDNAWMTKSNTTTPAAYYFEMYGGTFNATVHFFPAEYVNSSSNRFSWQRKYVSGTANITLSFEVYVKQ